jgi:16S rRNA U1498 N3-methylase RsmE
VRSAVLLEDSGVPGEDDLGDGCVIDVADLRHVVRQQIIVLHGIEQCEGRFIPDVLREVRGSGLKEACEEFELPPEPRMLFA